MTGTWVAAWVAVGITIGVLYVLIVQAIFDGISERREHRRRVEHEVRLTRLQTKAVTPWPGSQSGRRSLAHQIEPGTVHPESVNRNLG